MNIWSGAIVLNDQSQLRGLQLIDQSTSWQSDILKGSTLGFRSFVNPALIPLYARVGPNLELHTNDPETSRWLKNKLLGNIWLEDDELDRFQTVQCPVGFLVDLDGATRPRTTGPTTTDLLVYGILLTTTSHERPPTPPVSSSPETEEPISGTIKQELRIYATPISGSLITRAQALPSREHPQAIAGHEQFAQFLPDIHSPSPKRKRVATLFESVAQHHKRVRHKGGEGVSQLMAQSLSQPTHQLQSSRIKREPEEPALPILSKIAAHRSRSLSTSSNLNPNRAVNPRAENPRPSSNRGYARELTSARSTPVPVPLTGGSIWKERGLSPALLFSENKEPLPGIQDADTVISDNKNTITRTILTCMRLYGYNRTIRPASSYKLPHLDANPSHGEGRDTQIPGDSIALSAPTACSDEDEFKAMYHATYRASTFALRKYLRELPMSENGLTPMPPLLEKGKAMTYIDGFLKLFCEEEH
ncbi:hypothetical protein BDW59DRAFT_143517 [Aspergillus cavernicola]|uniref:Sld7 C-terminal domain-containing protein n=1 Tax=Aspergillus cavernicola TaxID=176166 RepID=A0ABR4IKH4_9EURO